MELNAAVVALAALAQETRLAVFRLLVEAGPEGLTVGRIGAATGAAPATLSFHLKELSRAGLVNSLQQSRFVYYSVNFAQMAALMTFLTQNCCRGMPSECLQVVETALGRCCAPVRSTRARSPSKARSPRRRS